jgi:hypothetical protein
MAELIHLVEITGYDPSRSNLFTYARDMSNGIWTKGQSTVTVDAATSFDGVVKADKWAEDGTTNFHLIAQTRAGFLLGQSVWLSIFAKAAGRTKFRVQTDTTAGTGTADFNLATGVTDALTGIAVESLMQPYGNGWFRCSTRVVCSANGSLILKLLMWNGAAFSYAGDGTSGFFLDHGLCEIGTVLGEPIDTAATAGPGTRVLRFASGLGLLTGASDTPPHVHFEPRLKQPMSFQRTMFASARVMGGSKVGAGEMVLLNNDQGLTYLRDLGIGGRSVTLRVGVPGAAFPAGYTTFLTGTAEQAEVGATTATIRLRDKLEVLGRPLQATLYAGTNALPSGAEGTADDIKGRPKPLLFGRRYQIAPVMVNTSRLIWQFHDGTAQAVDAVYDQGVALTASGTNRANLAAMEAAAPAAGQYDTCLSLGLIRLGAAPSGRITMDARGDATGSYVNTAADIASRILTQRCGIASGDLDSASFTALASAANDDCGFYWDGESTRQAALDAVLAGCGAWLAPTSAGLWQVGQLVAPTGTPDVELTDVEILDLDLNATRDADAGVPVWRVKVRYKPYTAIGRADLAGAVTEARKAELQLPWRETTASDSAVQTAHLLAPELVRDTGLADAADAAAEASRLLALHSVRRDFVRARVQLSEANAAIELGHVARITTARMGYSAGRKFIVVGIDADGRRGRMTLDLWG